VRFRLMPSSSELRPPALVGRGRSRAARPADSGGDRFEDPRPLPVDGVTLRLMLSLASGSRRGTAGVWAGSRSLCLSFFSLRGWPLPVLLAAPRGWMGNPRSSSSESLSRWSWRRSSAEALRAVSGGAGGGAASGVAGGDAGATVRAAAAAGVAAMSARPFAAPRERKTFGAKIENRMLEKALSFLARKTRRTTTTTVRTPPPLLLRVARSS